MEFDIFISYKRISLPTANNLYYRLTQRGYNVFFDLEEMRRNDFDKQIFKYIDGAKDVIVILEKHSLDACFDGTFRKDWFCKEICYALEKGKNVIPMIIDDYKFPEENELPEKIRGLAKKNYLEFSYSFFDDYVDKLIKKEYITAQPKVNNKANAVFNFYSDIDCSIWEQGRLIGLVNADSKMPFSYFPERVGDHLFVFKNTDEKEPLEKEVTIRNNEEKIVKVKFHDTTSKWKKNTCIIIGIWLVLFLVGGISMYLYDTFMDDDEAMTYICEGLRYDKSTNSYLYILPDDYIQYLPKTHTITTHSKSLKSNNIANIDLNYAEHSGFGLTTSLLLFKITKSLHLKNGKQVIGYVCIAAAFVVGVGVGCVIERMVFPPQYSYKIVNKLQDPVVWEDAIKQRKNGTFLQDAY